MAFFLFSLFFLISSASACDSCVYQTRVAYTGAEALSSGACGYGSLALGFNGKHLAAAVPSLYNSGTGCGACFQLRCQSTTLCNRQGTEVIITDLNQNNHTGFVLSRRAFRAMAYKGMDRGLLKLRLVNVEYKRIPCDYKNHNLSVRVEKLSQNPNNLAVQFLYQGGQTDIVEVDVAKVGSPNWTMMTQNNGTVWATDTAPAGPLQFRILVTSGYDGKWIWAQNVLPANWTIGVIYDSGVQISDIAQEACFPS